MDPIKFYQGTARQAREYLITGGKVLQANKVDTKKHPVEYEEFRKLVIEGEAPLIDDKSGSFQVVAPEPKAEVVAKPKPVEKKKGLFAKKEKKVSTIKKEKAK